MKRGIEFDDTPMIYFMKNTKIFLTCEILYFQTNPCKHPIIFMRDVEFEHLQSLLEFMYAGEVNISQAELTTFLRTAESLQIRGLTDSQSNQHNEKVYYFVFK